MEKRGNPLETSPGCMQGRQHVHTPLLPLIQLPFASNFTLRKDNAYSGRALSNWASPWARAADGAKHWREDWEKHPVLWQPCSPVTLAQRGQSSLCPLPSGSQSSGSRARGEGRRVSLLIHS